MSLSSQESVQTTYKFSLVPCTWIMETDNAVPKRKDTFSKLKTIRTELSLKNWIVDKSELFSFLMSIFKINQSALSVMNETKLSTLINLFYINNFWLFMDPANWFQNKFSFIYSVRRIKNAHSFKLLELEKWRKLKKK